MQDLSGFLSRLQGIVGGVNRVVGDAMAPYLTDPRRQLAGRAVAVVFPGSVGEVQGIVRIAAEFGVPIVPQGGNTGLVGGAISMSPGCLIVGLRRLNKVRRVDPLSNTIEVDAGVVLANVQAAAEQVRRQFPLRLGSEGSCQVGGILSTNAGGISVLRHGMTRELSLGLEVVLPDGELWDGMNSLRKDNTGYDLKQLFIGAEGTLGIITGAVLRMVMPPARKETAFVAVETVDAAVDLLHRIQAESAGLLEAFEYISGDALRLAVAKIPTLREPFDHGHAHNLLIELGLPPALPAEVNVLQGLLERFIEENAILDAVPASSESERRQFWLLREGVVQALWIEGGSISNDVSIPPGRIPEFLGRAAEKVRDIAPNVRILPFGHVGDGNIHYNVLRPIGEPAGEFLKLYDPLTSAVADVAVSLGGSFSAEHGVGRQKTASLSKYKNAGTLALMARIKASFDPEQLMNPGAVFPAVPPVGDP